MSARPALCGGYHVSGIPTAISMTLVPGELMAQALRERLISSFILRCCPHSTALTLDSVCNLALRFGRDTMPTLNVN
jgi:hypothetical protein